MARFRYIAKDKQGRTYKGMVLAQNAINARSKLIKKGLFAEELVKVRTRIPGLLGTDKIKTEELVLFTERLSVMVDAGMPVVRGLRTLADQTESGILKEVIYDICLELENGKSLSYGLGKHPEVFSNFYVNMVKAGETGGLLDRVLETLAEYLSKEHVLRNKIKGAFTYPLVVITAVFFVAGFLVTFVVPVFYKVYKQMGVSLPIPTVILVGASRLIGHYWWALILMFVGMILFYRVAGSTDSGRRAIDIVKLRFPLFGKLNKKVIITRFIRTFGALFANGVPIMENLRIVSELTGNKIVMAMINRMKREIGLGKKISESFIGEKFFPPMIIQMVSVGEETGELDRMLKKTADFLDRDIDHAISKMVVMLEPILTIMLAVIVGFIALAIYLPMFDMISNIKRF